MTDVADVEQLIAEISGLRGKIAQLQERVEQLDLLAHEDSLVDLPNRRGFMRALERLIDRVGRYQEKAALLFVDLDGLKLINDNFGHVAGDEALMQVARLLVGGVRRSDVVARIGGDEFAVLLVHSDEDSAHETARRLMLSYGVRSVVTPDINSFSQMVERAARMARSTGIAHIGDQLVVTAGVPFGTPGNTNTLRIAVVE